MVKNRPVTRIEEPSASRINRIFCMHALKVAATAQFDWPFSFLHENMRASE
jgi:hypothetical protein